MLLRRPLAIFDLKTTDIKVTTARIIEIGIIKIPLEQEKIEKRWLINPEVKIPAESIKFHGITDAVIKNAPVFKDVANDIFNILKGCDLAGFNSDLFAVPLLIKEFFNCGITFPSWDVNLVDISKYEEILNPNTLANIYKRYTGMEMKTSKKNGALGSAQVILEVLLHQTDANKEITPEEIDKTCQGKRRRFDLNQKMYIDEEGIVRWALGKNAFKPINDDINYLNWVMRSDFPEETKQKIQSLLKK